MEIRSGIGIGPGRFGMTPDETGRALGGYSDSFWKTPRSEAPTDAFDGHGTHIHYDSSGGCVAVEVAALGTPMYRAERLLGPSFESVVVWIRSLDPGLRVDPDGFTSFALGIGAYAPGHEEEPHAPVEAITVFEEGYCG